MYLVLLLLLVIRQYHNVNCCMKADHNAHHKNNFNSDSPTFIINVSEPHFHHTTTTQATTTTTVKTYECTTPIQTSGNNLVEVSSDVAYTADGETIAIVTCTVINRNNANNQNNALDYAWMNENGNGWFSSEDNDQTMVRTYKCNHETGSWYIGNTPTDVVRFVRCSNSD
uniref:C6 domain-containing protein n=1 Tax=Parastrongyloides trichosuri TaxID=131310 RepID=A0A0N4ZA35_PARTI